MLTLSECLDGTVRLLGLRLLVLSACETSVIEVRRAADEVVGLASSFLQAGAAGVIASLWPVYDHATFLLMCRFLQFWLDPALGWSPARCLAAAQHWLREEATNAVIAAYDPTTLARAEQEAATTASHTAPTIKEVGAEMVDASLRSLRFTAGTALQRIQRTAQLRDDPNELPYEDPIYWAAFTVTGC